MKRLTEKDKGYIAGALQRGESIAAIAKHIGCSRAAVYAYIRRQGAEKAVDEAPLAEILEVKPEVREHTLLSAAVDSAMILVADPETYSRETVKILDILIKDRREWAKIMHIVSGGAAPGSEAYNEAYRKLKERIDNALARKAAGFP